MRAEAVDSNLGQKRKNTRRLADAQKLRAMALRGIIQAIPTSLRPSPMIALPAAMDCQFCDGPAELGTGRPSVFKYQMHCVKCGMRGAPTLESIDGTGAESAIASWNRLQGLIAKGRLLEADNEPAKSKRL